MAHVLVSGRGRPSASRSSKSVAPLRAPRRHVCRVSPADEPHGTRRSKISALLEAHAREDFEVASDMLTRTSEFDDMAPDVSVFPKEATLLRWLSEAATCTSIGDLLKA